MSIKNFIQFVKENLEQKVDDPEEIIYLHVSRELVVEMEKWKDTFTVAQLLYGLSYGIPRKYLAKNYADYIQLEENGYVSYLKPRYWNEPEPYTTIRRVSQKVTKSLKEIYNDDYIKSRTTPKDFEDFLIKMTALSSPAKVEEYRGKELLRGYNFNREFNPKFGHSCANFYQKELGGYYKDPKVEEYNVWVENPDNCGVVVVWDKGQIVARRSFQQGIQVCDSRNWKKGEFHTIWGSFYGIGANGKYDTMIREYLMKKYPGACGRGNGGGVFCIEMETRWEIYPAFDSMYVCFDHNLLSDYPDGLPAPFYNYNWTRTYTDQNKHLQAPQKYLDLRDSEKK